MIKIGVQINLANEEIAPKHGINGLGTECVCPKQQQQNLISKDCASRLRAWIIMIIIRSRRVILPISISQVMIFIKLIGS
jgi:hypothetical protein